ncbi:hypothetical protein JB92DRAFT_2824591 [Gautieria morchelliformis]|nr:hypothetical protein JB92DRAFT_2824591 [Gautieria morchelliformis]
MADMDVKRTVNPANVMAVEARSTRGGHVYEFRRSGLCDQIAEAWAIEVVSFEPVIESRIDRFSGGGVSVEDDLSGDAKKMLNKQLHFLDGLERLAEGKSLDGNGKGLSDDNLKPYNVHLWIMSLELPNCPNKELRIQAVTPALWKAYRQQLKESYLYKEKAKNVNLYGKAINPLEIRNIFTPGSWVVAQVTPTLWDITMQEGGIPCHTKTYQLVINCVQLALKCTDDVKRDRLEGSSSSVLKHRHDDDVQREESPPLAPAPKRTLLGVRTFTSSPVPATKMPSFKKKVSK